MEVWRLTAKPPDSYAYCRQPGFFFAGAVCCCLAAVAPSTSTPALAITTMCWHTDTHTWLQVKHAPKLGTYRLDHMSVSQEHAPPAGEAEAPS